MDISVVIPLYNEAESLPELFAWIERVMKEHNFSYEVIFINDGSTDNSWEVIEALKSKNPEVVHAVKFRRNYGKSPGLNCGFQRAKGDVVITMDADLQDDINVIDRFVEKYMEGCDVVYGVRNKRETDTFFKRTTAEGFYKFMKILGVDVVFNHADYRLMSRRALEGLSDLMVTLRAVKKRLNPSISIFGVLLTMYDGRTNFSAQVAEEVRRHFPGKVFAAAIPRNVRLSEAPSHGMPVCAYDKFSRGAAAYDAVAQEILAKEQ